MNVIDYNTLRKIIAEEVKAAAPRILRENDEDENTPSVAEQGKVLKTITEKAGNLLSAIESFEDNCPEGCMAPTSAHISALKKILDNMMRHSGDYLNVRTSPNVPGDVDGLRSVGD
jgi:hypothetical protein